MTMTMAGFFLGGGGVANYIFVFFPWSDTISAHILFYICDLEI